MTRVQLQPSPFDRLDPIAQSVRWWTGQMLDMLSRPNRTALTSAAVDGASKRLPPNITIVLAESDGFYAHVRLPKGYSDAHRQALDLQLPDIAPTPPDSLTVAATAIARETNGVTTYGLAMARQDRLDQLEASARRHGARSVVFTVDGSPVPELQSPKAAKRARLNLIVDASIAVAIAAAAAVATSIWTARITADTETLSASERSLRRAAVAIEAARKGGDVSRQLVERGILTRRGGTVMETLATLNAATPTEAWWTRVRWTPDEITISGQSSNATAAITALSAAAKGWSVELSGSLTAAPANRLQDFEVLAKPRKPPSP